MASIFCDSARGHDAADAEAPTNARIGGPKRAFVLSRAAAPVAPRRKWRVALYSHDTMGIGHMRRNLLIARELMASSRLSSSLLIAGARQAAVFDMPGGIDCVTLPSMSKHATGRYHSRSLKMSLKRLVELRAGIIFAALKAYQPDVFIVDKAPRGAAGELEPVLAALRKAGKTRCVLGLREVLDDPESVRTEWRKAANEEAIAAFYDAVWVYGDPEVCDPVREYAFRPETAAKVRYTGYFDQRRRLQFADADDDPLAALKLPPGRLMLCMVGGGQDGETLGQVFLSARFPEDANGVLVTGPFMPPEVRQRLQIAVAGSRRLRVVEFLAEPSLLLSRADRLVIMGGYNTVTEALSFEKRTLVVPRVMPRREQWIRAERLRELGLLDVLSPNDLEPAALSAWLARDLPAPPPARERLDFDGLSRLPKLLNELFAPHRHNPCGESAPFPFSGALSLAAASTTADKP